MARPLVAISGLGSIGRQHLRVFASLADIVAFDPSAALREQAAQVAGVRTVCAEFEQLLDAGPTALVVAAPDHVHVDQLRAAAAREIPTLVEKPLAPSYQAAREIDMDGTPALVGYVLRHRTVVQRTRDILAGGDIGVPVSAHAMLGAYSTITAAVSRFASPEPDRLYRDYSHEWDYLRWFFGAITRAFAAARTVTSVPHVETPNCVDGLLEFDVGMRATFHLDYLEPLGTRTVQVLGTGGSLLADFGRGTITVRTASDPARHYDLPEPPSAALARQAEHLIAVALGAERPRVTLRDGLAALAVTDAVRRSAATGTWQDLPDQDA